MFHVEHIHNSVLSIEWYHGYCNEMLQPDKQFLSMRNQLNDKNIARLPLPSTSFILQYDLLDVLTNVMS